MVESTAIWCTFSSAFIRLVQSFAYVQSGKPATGSMFKNGLSQIQVVHLLERRLSLILHLRVMMMTGNYHVMELVIQQIPGRKEAVGWHS